MQRPTRVLILWGVPGTGKSTFANYLVTSHGFVRIDSDAGGVGGSKSAEAWRGLLAVLGTPAQFPAASEFVRIARENPQPVVVEYGMWANEDGIELLRTLRDAGAEAWWFDGDRTAAFTAWKVENVKAARNMIDHQWRNVVRVTDANYPALKAFFGGNMVRTIEAGPVHVAPEVTYKLMFDREQ